MFSAFISDLMCLILSSNLFLQLFYYTSIALFSFLFSHRSVSESRIYAQGSVFLAKHSILWVPCDDSKVNFKIYFTDTVTTQALLTINLMVCFLFTSINKCYWWNNNTDPIKELVSASKYSKLFKGCSDSSRSEGGLLWVSLWWPVNTIISKWKHYTNSKATKINQ